MHMQKSVNPLKPICLLMHSHVFPTIAFQVACSVADSIAKLRGFSGGTSSGSGTGRVYPGEQS